MKKAGHNSITGMLQDIEKYNQAAIYGWKLLRFESNSLLKESTIEKIKEAFENKTINYSVEKELF